MGAVEASLQRNSYVEYEKLFLTSDIFLQKVKNNMQILNNEDATASFSIRCDCWSNVVPAGSLFTRIG